MIRLALLAVFAVWLTADTVLGDPGKPDIALSVEIGWRAPVRVGRWNPIFVTAADRSTTAAQPRAVSIEVIAGQGSNNVIKVSQVAALGPVPATFMLLLPLSSESPGITLRDQASGKTLATWPQDKSQFDLRQSMSTIGGNKHLIGVSGAYSPLPNLVAGGDLQAEVGFLPPDWLPIQPLGYDSLDLLILNRPNLNQFSPDSQAAIVEWVRAGGLLLLWPSGDPIPDGPLASALPCKIGVPRSMAISGEGRILAELADRFTAVTGYPLTPDADAETIPLFADLAGKSEIVACTKRVGFGRITVVPFDVSLLQFKEQPASAESDTSATAESNNPPAKKPPGPAHRLFDKLTTHMGLNELRGSRGEQPSYYGAYNPDPINSRQEQATSRLEDFLGNVPGAGKFGFSYVAWVVLGMMVIVGPVDWFVLRKLGRQPWTWVTTTGWIGVITCAALLMARVFKSGDLYFNTVELIDQADDRVVARNTLVGIYSPRTADYRLDGVPGVNESAAAARTGNEPPAPAGWWSPPSANDYEFGNNLKIDHFFHQSVDGMDPLPMSINVWNLRFVQGQIVGGKQDPVVAATLRRVNKSTSVNSQAVYTSVLEGTVENLTSNTLTEIRVGVGLGMPTTPGENVPGANPEQRGVPSVIPDINGLTGLPQVIDRLGPHESKKFEFADLQSHRFSQFSAESASNPMYPRYYNYYNNEPPPSTDKVWAYIGDLACRRTWRMSQESASGQTAVVFARIADAQPTVLLSEPGAKQKHEALVRAVVKVREER